MAATGCGQLTFTTPSTKKRKVGRPEPSDDDHFLVEQLASTRAAASSVAQARTVLPLLFSSASDPGALRSQSSSPPIRHLPLHLQNPVPDGPGRFAAASSESAFPTAASSPSRACAGLTLDGDQDGDMSREDVDGDGDLTLKSPTLPAGSPRFPAMSSSNDAENVPERSSSPALKRSASELDEQRPEPDVGTEVGSPLRMVSVPATTPMDGVFDGSRGSEREDDAASPQPNGRSPPGRLMTVRPLSRLEADEEAMVGTATSGLAVNDGPVHAPNGAAAAPSPADENPGEVAPGTADASDIPSIDEQIAQVTALTLKPLGEGDRGHVVPCKWLARVMARGSDKPAGRSYGKDAAEGEIGAVDNSDLVPENLDEWKDLKDETGQPFVPLKPGLVMGEHFDMFPQEAWHMIERWYGSAPNSPDIIRFVHNTNTDGDASAENLVYELYPPLFTVVKVRHDAISRSTQEVDASPIKIIASRYEAFNRFLRRAKILAKIPLASKVRIWRVIRNQQLVDDSHGTNGTNGMPTPAASRTTSPVLAASDVFDKVTAKLGLDLQLFQTLEDGSQRELLEVADSTANENYNGRMNLALAGLSQDDVIVLEERVRGADGGDWLTQASRAVAATVTATAGIPISITKGRTTTVQNQAKTRGTSGSRQSSPAPAAGGIMTRGRARKNGRSVGTCGLSNLGNTCYMNSALQCVRSVEELTQYFRLQRFKADLNPSNPLSYNGEIAKTYANLLDQIYAPSCPASVAPRSFKNTIGRHGPSFSGYGQQDSQEFLGFLLSGLHEDLNRIQKKPYIEKPDSTDEMVHDPKALHAFADRFWEIHKARDDSVVMDLFAGTYKSTLVCPVCEKVSITFDPFTNLTLQLPIENVWSKKIFYFPRHERPVQVLVDMDKHGSIRTMKEFVGARVKVAPERLHAAEIYKAKFYKAYEDSNCVSEVIQQNDDVAVFELDATPTNWPPPKEKPGRTQPYMPRYSNSDDDEDAPRWDSPIAESLLVPVFHRVVRDQTSRFQSQTMFGIPTYIVLGREEAWDYDVVLRKVLNNVQTLTTRELFEEDSDEGANGAEDDVVVVTTSDDADSSAETRTKTQSVEGEEDMVSVSIGDAQAPPPTEAVTVEGRKNKKRALGRRSFIRPELRNLFQMRVFRQPAELVPTGWNSKVEDDRDLTLVASRIPQTPSESPLDEAPDGPLMPGDEASSESETDRAATDYTARTFRLQSEAWDSDSDHLPPVRNLLSHDSRKNARSTYRGSNDARRRRTGPKHTYSRKQKRSALDSPEEAPQGPLVRLGEGIVLDWDPRAHATLFTGSDESNPMLGAPTWESCGIMPDEELERKIALRSTRRRQGVTLADCLDEFGKEEILSENNAWYCPKCKEFRRASKKFELWKAPDVLIIHLKRFSASGGLRDKVDIMVDFPTEALDLTERVALKEEGKSLEYDLFAVDNHYGGLGGGHYTAIARNFVDGEWYDYNDTMTSKRGPQQAVTNAAYLLFYRRRSDRPLGGPYFEKIMEECQEQDESSPSSRASSAGDDRGFGGSSRAGSSNECHGAAAARRERNAVVPVSARTAIESDAEEQPPVYSSLYPESHDDRDHAHATVEKHAGADRMDLDEGVDTSYSHDGTGTGTEPFSQEPKWSFDNPQIGMLHSSPPVPPPGSSDEDLMADISDKAADGSSTNLSDRADRMADFADEEEDDDNDNDAGLADDPFRSSPPRRPIRLFQGSSPPVTELPLEASSSSSSSSPSSPLPPPGDVSQFRIDLNEDVVVDEHDHDHDDDPVAEVHVEMEQEQEQEQAEQRQDRDDGTGRML